MIELHHATRPQWDDLLTQAGRSSLVQSWAWGEIKAEQGWRPLRLVVWSQGRPVALAQVLERRLGGIIRLARLNRGPVWLAETPPMLKRAVMAALLRRWRCWNLAALFMAPELSATEADLLPNLGIWRRAAPCWRSAWLDLSKPTETLRKNLDGKWRNMLVGGEKAGLVVETGSDRALLDWLLDRHAEAMRDKGFAGTPVDAITGLYRHRQSDDDLLVLRAVLDGVAVGGILLARHGAAATYLVGWSDDQGRKTKANTMLLWQGMLALAQRGCQWLDLGGIDPVGTPGIAAFKRGLRGEEYELAGEFVCL